MVAHKKIPALVCTKDNSKRQDNTLAVSSLTVCFRCSGLGFRPWSVQELRSRKRKKKKKKDTSKKTEIRGFERREDLEEVAFLYKNLREETMGVSRGEEAPGRGNWKFKSPEGGSCLIY